VTLDGSVAVYAGVDNLEVMACARNYLRFLNDSIAQVAGDPQLGPRLLDFGAGTGTHALDLRARGYVVSCAEIDDALRTRLAVEGFDVRPSPDEFEARTFQVVYTMNVLEHIEDDAAALRSLCRVLRPGGLLLVYVPALEQLRSSMDRKVGHVRRYHRRPLIELVSRAGFEVDRASYVDSLGYFTTLLYRLVGSRNGDISTRAVALYDRAVFPVSRAVDRFTGLRFGKNLLLVARRPVNGA
jgi:SAM-dependent methyltransferase